MTGIARNGLSGLALRVALIAVAAIVFGCAPQAPSAGGRTVTPVVVALR